MALPPRLWLPEAGHDLPTAVHGGSLRPATSSPASGSTPAQRLRRRALWRGEAGLPDRPVLVEWFPLADFEHERAAARRVRGLCHVHLLRLLDIGLADARNAYAVSEAPDGVDLFTVLRAAPGELPPFFGVSVVRQVARALLALEKHLLSSPRRHGGHGRVNLGTVFVGWDGSVKLLAFAPLGPLGSSGRAEESGAPELRLSDRLLTSAADVYALGVLLRELLPPSALRRREFQRLMRRCLHTQADQRIALSTLELALEELLIELRAPLHRAQAIGEVLGRSCPRATTDLVDADWGEHTGDGYPALPPTLAPLSASTVLLSPAWLRAQPPEKSARRSLMRRLAAPLGLGFGIAALAGLSLWGLGAQSPPIARAQPIEPPPIAATEEPVAPPPSELLPGLRTSIERIERTPQQIAITLRLTNPTAQPIAANTSALRLALRSAPEATLEPLSSPTLTVGAGRVQELRLTFYDPQLLGPKESASPPRLLRSDVILKNLPLRDSASVTK
jgi:hypothetical protein